MSLRDKIRKPLPSRGTGSVWAGPESSADNGGITFSLLSRFLVCRERFKALVVDGITTKDRFNSKLQFGSMWHICEEHVHSGWQDKLGEYGEELFNKYPLDREEVNHWLGLCHAEFPMYLEYWSEHPDTQTRELVMPEEVFHTQYVLPSGRIVWLKGKRDGVSLVGEEKGVWVDEHKSKSSIDPIKIQRQLSFDLQTMLYVISVEEDRAYIGDNTLKARTSYRKGPMRHFYPFKGVRYNVVRRSAHKSVESMIKKCSEDIRNGRGGEWFSKWDVEITQRDIEVFKRTCFNPILENLCNWWASMGRKVWTAVEQDAAAANLNWRHPFGVYNVLDEGGSSDLDNYLATGSMLGLEKTKELFPELKA